MSFLAHYVVTNENGSGFVGTVDMQLTNTAIIAFLFSVSSNDARQQQPDASYRRSHLLQQATL